MYMYKSFTSDKKIKLDFIEMATICIDKGHQGYKIPSELTVL